MKTIGKEQLVYFNHVGKGLARFANMDTMPVIGREIGLSLTPAGGQEESLTGVIAECVLNPFVAGSPIVLEIQCDALKNVQPDGFVLKLEQQRSWYGFHLVWHGDEWVYVYREAEEGGLKIADGVSTGKSIVYANTTDAVIEIGRANEGYEPSNIYGHDPEIFVIKEGLGKGMVAVKNEYTLKPMPRINALMPHQPLEVKTHKIRTELAPQMLGALGWHKESV